MEKTRFFVDCHVFDGNFQGTTTYIKGLYSELIKHEKHHFFFGASNIEFLKSVFGTHENLTYVKYRSKNKFHRLLFDIPNIIKKNKIDYAHFQYVIPPIKKCKYIVTVHDVLFLDFPQYFPLLYRLKNKFLFKISAKYSDVVLTVSEYSKVQIQKHFKIEKVSVTNNAVDPIFFESYNKQEVKELVADRFKITNYFIYVSRWEPRKNHHNLLKVFVEKEYYHNYSLVFIGDKAINNSDYVSYYSSLPEHIKAKIFEFNKVNFEDLLLFVRGADLSIYPSIAEGFGIPPLESLAAKIPTICSNTTAMEDFYFLKELQFNPLIEKEIFDKIQLALLDKNWSKRTIEMKEKYNWHQAKLDFIKAINEHKKMER